MTPSRLAALAALVAGFSLQTAMASGLPAEPRLVWGLSFGGAANVAPTAELAFDLPSHVAEQPTVAGAQLELSEAGSALRLMGVALWQRRDALAQNESAPAGSASAASSSPWYEHQWVYWTLGSLAATAALASSGGTSVHSSSNNTTTNGTSGRGGIACGGANVGPVDTGSGCVVGCPGPSQNSCIGLIDLQGMSAYLKEADETWLEAGTGGMGDLVAR